LGEQGFDTFLNELYLVPIHT